MAAHSPEYEAVLESDAWHERRRERAARTNGTCERCGAGGILQLHHLTYERLGRERDSDLELLCPTCHEEADQERREETAQAEFQRFVERRYGDGWGIHMDSDDAREAFAEWQEWADG
jgi:phage terminase large subunit GpA-like protein